MALELGECRKQTLQLDPCSIKKLDSNLKQDQSMTMGIEYAVPEPLSSLEDSATSIESSSSSDLGDDVSSSVSSSPTSHGNGPLFELQELMAHLPIKRGLSRFYKGKSQSFTSLSRVRSIEDLAKKEAPFRRRMKAYKSFGNGLDAHRAFILPKATICKRVSPFSFVSLSSSGGER